MDNNTLPILCGGTFFTLLLETAKQELKERKKFGEAREFAETDVFEALIQVAVNYRRPNDKKNFGSAVSAYKSCNSQKSGRLPIHEQANISTFDNLIKINYQTPLAAMTSLVDNYIDTDGKGVWLVKALLDIIKQSITDDAVFYVCKNGNFLAKSDLCDETDFYLPAFLLGIWHYIVINKVDNGTGQSTYDSWCGVKNERHEFLSSIGVGIVQSITLITAKDVIEETANTGSATVEDEPFIDFCEPNTEPPEAEPTANTTTQIINSPAMFFNSGANSIQINNTGILNIDRGGKSEK